MRATAIVRTNSSGSSRSVPCSGVPGTCTSLLIGTDSGCGSRLGELRDQPGALAPALAHADDAAAAHFDAGAAHVLQRVEPLLVGRACWMMRP